MLRSSTQNARLHTLINSLGIDKETKAGLVYQYTAGRSDSSADLTYQECQQLIKDLSQKLLKSAQDKANTNKADRLRKKIISLFREMNYQTEAGKADMQRIKATLLHKWGKDINRYTEAELRRIIAVLQKDWVPHYYKK